MQNDVITTLCNGRVNCDPRTMYKELGDIKSNPDNVPFQITYETESKDNYITLFNETIVPCYKAVNVSLILLLLFHRFDSIENDIKSFLLSGYNKNVLSN